MKQTNLRPTEIESNENISFPVGTALAVQKYGDKLGFDDIFSRFKSRGVVLARLVEALVAYRLTENQSISCASKWINRPDVLRQFGLCEFEERTLFRALELVGSNYEEAIHLLQNSIFSQYDFPHTDVNLDWTSLVLWGDKAQLGEYGYSRAHRWRPESHQFVW